MMVIRHFNKRYKSKCSLYFILISFLLVINFSIAIAQAADKPQKIKAVVIKYFPPLYKLDEQGNPQGYAIEQFTEIAKIANLEIEYVIKNNWKETLNALEKAEADIIPNLGVIKNRQEIFDFSSVVEILQISIFVREGTKYINSVNDLIGKKVGVVSHNVGEKIANNLSGLNTKVYAQPEHALIGLASGNVDAVIYPKPIMLKYIRNSGLEKRIIAVEKPIKELKRAIAFQKGNIKLEQKLNAAIKIFLRSEKYTEIYQKWYGKEKAYWHVEKVITISLVVIVLIIIIFIIWRYQSIKKINNQLTTLYENLKRAENERDKTSELLKKTASRAPGLVYQYEVRPDGSASFPYASEAIRDIYKVSPEVAKYDVAKVFEVLHPDDYDEIVASINKSAETLEPWKLEYRVRYDDGTVRWLLGNALPERTGEGGTLWHGFITDITEYKSIEKSLEQAHMIIEDSPVVIFQWGASEGWPVEFVSENVEHFGYTAEELLSGEISFSSIIHPDDLERVAQEVEKHTADIENSFQQEYRIVGPDGHIYWTDDRTIIERDEEGNVTHYHGTVLDVTERKNIEEQLRRSQKMDALGQLTGGIAHDFNNLLGVVMGYAELLEANLAEDPLLKKYAHEINYAGVRGAKLTKKLLSFSKKENSELVNLSVNRLLADEQHMLEKTLTARITLIYDLDNELWPILIDEGDLEDAIINISINAMHAMKEAGTFTVKTKNVKLNSPDAERLKINAGEYISIQFSDTGCGIDEVTIAKIFDPFFTTKGKEGTGLGLSQVYAFVKRSKGAVDIHSVLEKGTDIKLYLPRCADVAIQKDEIKKIIKNNSDVKKLTGTEIILIVDDESALLTMASEILSMKGYKIFTAKSGKDALAILEKEKIDFLLSDVIMPEMDGYQLAIQVQEKHPHVKIQLASGFSDDRHIGVKDSSLHENLLKKPYAAYDLLIRIRELLDS